jgi:CelD/BcsL family acetyltransferase involved in cellulose biosynthesis
MVCVSLETDGMAFSLSATHSITDQQSFAIEGTAASATLSLITSVIGLRELASKWRSLECNTVKPVSVFQSFDWIMSWAETYCDTKGGPTLHILAGYEQDELVFVWPLMRASRFGAVVLTWVTDPFGQYGDVLVRKGQNPTPWIKGATNLLKRLRDIDILRLRHVRNDSHIGAFAKQFLHDGRMPEKAPFLDLTQFENDEAYDARYTSTQRKRRKKIKKSLEEFGDIKFTRITNGVIADKAMQNAITEKNAWLKERGRMNRVLGCAGHLTFLKNLSRRNGSIDVVVTEMTAGEKPVSWEVGFRFCNRHYGYITSHLNALTDYSPGRLHMDYSQRAALAAGMDAFDLMVPNDAHKESWSSNAVDTNDYYLPISIAGRAIGHGLIRTLRPIVRRMYYRLEGSGVRKLNPFTLSQKKIKTAKDA